MTGAWSLGDDQTKPEGVAELGAVLGPRTVPARGPSTPCSLSGPRACRTCRTCPPSPSGTRTFQTSGSAGPRLRPHAEDVVPQDPSQRPPAGPPPQLRRTHNRLRQPRRPRHRRPRPSARPHHREAGAGQSGSSPQRRPRGRRDAAPLGAAGADIRVLFGGGTGYLEFFPVLSPPKETFGPTG